MQLQPALVLFNKWNKILCKWKTIPLWNFYKERREVFSIDKDTVTPEQIFFSFVSLFSVRGLHVYLRWAVTSEDYHQWHDSLNTENILFLTILDAFIATAVANPTNSVKNSDRMHQNEFFVKALLKLVIVGFLTNRRTSSFICSKLGSH